MDLEFLLSNAKWFNHEYRKFFNGDEMPVKYFVTNNYVVILSTKKLCIFYYDQYIDFKDDYLTDSFVKKTDTLTFEITLNNKLFDVEFKTLEDANLFEGYYNKYGN